MRILSNPAYISPAETPGRIVRRLRTLCGSSGHAFWAEQVSLRDARLFHSNLPATHRQITDIYLLGLATRREGRLATFDRSIALAAVLGAQPENLTVIPA